MDNQPTPDPLESLRLHSQELIERSEELAERQREQDDRLRDVIERARILGMGPPKVS